MLHIVINNNANHYVYSIHSATLKNQGNTTQSLILKSEPWGAGVGKTDT
jgi:hypothetical protein